eukprot:355729_1
MITCLTSHLFICCVAFVHSDNGICNDNCTTTYSEYISSIMNISNWTEPTSSSYLKTFYLTDLGQCILNMNTSKGEIRPNPKCYIPQIVMDYHFHSYNLTGGSSIITTYYAALDNFTSIGYDNTQWISPYIEQVEMLLFCKEASSPSNCTLTALGQSINEYDMFSNDPGTGINRVMQMHLYSKYIYDLNIRIPSGNEVGVDKYWRPGGYTSGGISEAIVDIIIINQYCWNAVTDVNGNFCYPNCDIVCNNVAGCMETNCEYVEVTSDDNTAGIIIGSVIGAILGVLIISLCIYAIIEHSKSKI